MHDGSEELSRQVLDVRVTQSSDGPRVRSVGRLDALKAAVFAIEEARKLNAAPQIW